jgi:hypothetical protein
MHHVFDFHGGPPSLEFSGALDAMQHSPRFFSTIQPIGCDRTSASRSQKKGLFLCDRNRRIYSLISSHDRTGRSDFDHRQEPAPSLEQDINVRAFCCSSTDLEQKNYDIPAADGSRYPVLAAHDLGGALANVPRQDADCEGLIGVNVYGSAARLEFTVAHRTRGA